MKMIDERLRWLLRIPEQSTVPLFFKSQFLIFSGWVTSKVSRASSLSISKIVESGQEPVIQTSVLQL